MSIHSSFLFLIVVKKELFIFIICLLVSFLLWVIHQLNQTYIGNYNINVCIVQIPESYSEDTIIHPIKIEIKASGLKTLMIERYVPDTLYLPFRVLKKTSKKNVYQISSAAISGSDVFPVKFKLMRINPDTVYIPFKLKKKSH